MQEGPSEEQGEQQKWSLSAFNTYWCEDYIRAQDGIPRGITFDRLDRGDFGGFWDFLDKTKYEETHAFMKSHRALKEELKKCAKCGETLTLDNFFKDKGGKNYRKSRCKTCEGLREKTTNTPKRDNGSSVTPDAMSSTPLSFNNTFYVWLDPERVESALETLKEHCKVLRKWLQETEAMCDQLEVLHSHHQVVCASADQVETLKARIKELEVNASSKSEESPAKPPDTQHPDQHD